MTKVSIITPAYNAAHWLPQTVESVLSQDYPNLEYLIFDDGSTDNTKAVLAQFQSDPRCHIFRHENMGEVKTINKGYQMARGDLIGNISADDPLWTTQAVSRMVQTAEQHPEALVFYPDFCLADKTFVILSVVITREWDYQYMITHHHCTPGPGALMRRKVFDLVGYRNPDPDIRWVADLEYWLRIGMVGSMKRVPHVLATHRRHAEQLTIKMQGKAMARQHIYLYERFFSQPCLPVHLRELKPQAMAYTYLTCCYVSRDWPSRIKYLAKAIQSYPPISREIGPLALTKGVQLFSLLRMS